MAKKKPTINPGRKLTGKPVTRKELTLLKKKFKGNHDPALDVLYQADRDTLVETILEMIENA